MENFEPQQNAANLFIANIKTIPFFKPQGEPKPEWEIFNTRDDALDAAGKAAWYTVGAAAVGVAVDIAKATAVGAAKAAAKAAGRDATWDSVVETAFDTAWNATWTVVADATGDATTDAALDAAKDAALLAQILHVSDLIDPKHVKHATGRWAVWEAGYGLLCDVNGILYVYRNIT